LNETNHTIWGMNGGKWNEYPPKISTGRTEEKVLYLLVMRRLKLNSGLPNRSIVPKLIKTNPKLCG
jgi:hypothetical protein